MKSVEYYLQLNYKTAHFRIEVGDLSGCVTHGESPDEAFRSLEGALRAWRGSRLAMLFLSVLFAVAPLFSGDNSPKEDGKIGKDFTVLMAVGGAAAVSDAITTRMGLARGGYEKNSWLYGRHPSSARTSLTLAGQFILFNAIAWKLDRHHHHRIARVFQLFFAGQEIDATVRNSLFLAH